MKKISLYVFFSFAGMLCWAFTANCFTKDYQKELFENEWVAERIQNKADYQITDLTAKPYQVKFTKDEITFKLEVNSYKSSVNIEANTIKGTNKGGNTEICCDSAQGDLFASTLTSPLTKSYKINRHWLIVKDKKYIIWLKKASK